MCLKVFIYLSSSLVVNFANVALAPLYVTNILLLFKTLQYLDKNYLLPSKQLRKNHKVYCKSGMLLSSAIARYISKSNTYMDSEIFDSRYIRMYLICGFEVTFHIIIMQPTPVRTVSGKSVLLIYVQNFNQKYAR